MHTANLSRRQSCPRLGPVLAVLLCLLSSGLVFAQGTKPAPVPSGPSPTKARGIDISFPGGSAIAYLEAVGAAANFEGFVIHQRELLAQLTLPVVKLRGADVATAVEVMTSSRYELGDGAVAAVEAQWVGPAGAPRGHGFTLPSEQDFLAGSACILTVQTDRRSVPKVAKVVPALRTVFDLSPLKKANTTDIQALLDAVTIAIEMDGASASFQAKYHEPSQLLIVRGTPVEIMLVREIITVRVPRGARQSAGDPPNVEDVAGAEIPPAVTDDELNRMSPEELYELTTSIVKALKANPSLDADTQSRLRDVMQKAFTKYKNAS